MQHALVIVIDINPSSLGAKKGPPGSKSKIEKKNHRGIRNKKFNFLTKFYGGLV